MDAAELLISSGSTDGSSGSTGGGCGSTGGGCGSSSEAGRQAGGSQGGRLPDAVAAQAAAAIKSAVDDGYMAALTISRTNADALVGTGAAGNLIGATCAADRQDLLEQHLLLHWLRLKGAGKHKAPRRVQQTPLLHRAQAGACTALCCAVLCCCAVLWCRLA